MNRTNITTRELLERRAQGLFQTEHVLRHFISGTIVFALGVAADVLIDQHLLHRAQRVRWPDGAITVEYLSREVPTNPGAQIELGMVDDGRVAWRVKADAR